MLKLIPAKGKTLSFDFVGVNALVGACAITRNEWGQIMVKSGSTPLGTQM